MMFRKSKDGSIRPIFLTAENTDYCFKVLDLFKSSLNSKKSEIEDRLKILELKSQNPKFVKGLALLLFRYSDFERASTLEPEKVRESIFREAHNPAFSPEQKYEILERVAHTFNVSAHEIEEAMYADKESEQILRKVYDANPDTLAKQFNLEQLETMLLKSVELKISEAKNWSMIYRKVKSLGLLYSIDHQNAITVSGPVSVLEQTERYGARLALLLRYLVSMHEWRIDAKIVLKDSEKVKKEYLLSLNSSVSYYLPPAKIEEPKVPDIKYRVVSAEPVIIGDQAYIADYSIEIQGSKIYIDISRPVYVEKNRKVKELMRLNHINWEIFYYIENNEKSVKGEICFKNNVDWAAISKYLEDKYDKKENDLEMIKRNIETLYPDSDRIIEYLESEGYVPDKILKSLGYRVKWEGLRLRVL
jgi:predicted nuclease of restriction endonuclease-like RecB superfamily